MRSLENQLSEIALEVTEKTGDFVIEQAPLLLQEFYNWHLAKNIMELLFGLFTLLLGQLLLRLLTRKEDEVKDFDELTVFGRTGNLVPVVFTNAISLIFGLCFLISGLYKLVFLLVSPKIYLIEYFVK